MHSARLTVHSENRGKLELVLEYCLIYEYEDGHVMQDAQDERSQICLNYVTKGPNVIANISRIFFCFVYIVCTKSMLSKSKMKINST